MLRLVKWLVLLGVVVLATGYWMTRPVKLDPLAMDGLVGDAEAGALVFAAGGCASCHAAPDATGEAKLILAGGHAFPSDFGTFYAPNISPDPAKGIGGWQAVDLANAMLFGTSPAGQHYYPAFPYTSYDRSSMQDIADLWAYMQTLPLSGTPSKAHDVGFPFSIRASLGGWKLLFAGSEPTAVEPTNAEMQRGQYLVEVLGHCGECHTSRNALGGVTYDAWLGGAPNPSGQGRIPNITPAALDWSEADLVEYFTSGFTPDFDSAGGEMAAVIENLAKLPESDRAAIAAYLKMVPPVE